ncbi:MAG: AGE family epimerase/isomerase [Bacteroidales bacterium]|nr:AGE family epimerase/isomerase [Bacteroidales bacterium]MBN2820731.1 AGE family epimerase/isomerase [Bacteroidales bacterium]
MDYYLERIKTELTRIMNFWMNHLISETQSSVYPEIDINNSPNTKADMGCLFLGRVMYGASAACRFLNTNEYKILADLAFKTLYEQFKNPAGGFYWSKNMHGEVIHDSDNVNMGQATVLYGLAEYAHLTKNPVVEAELKKLSQFINLTLHDNNNGGFLDGYDRDWKQEKNFTKALATHIHVLEALVKKYEFTGNETLIIQINELVDIIVERFIDKSNLECYHRLSPGWDKLKNENWAGHNAEISWILYHSIAVIKYKEQKKAIGELAVRMTQKVLDVAFDKQYGGVFNVISDNQAAFTTKDWWPQAETAIACLNAYEISNDKNFLSYALRLIEYIENTFYCSNGEWFTSVSREGQPVSEIPKIHFWKSMYHNVRYCIEIHNRISLLSKKP